MPRRLLFICHNYYPDSTADAVRLAAIVRMCSNRYDCTVVCSSGGQSQGKEKVIPVDVPSQFSSNVWIRLWQEWKLYRIYRKEIQLLDTDAAFISSPPYLAFKRIRRKLLNNKAKVFHDLRDPYPQIISLGSSLQQILHKQEMRLSEQALHTFYCSNTLHRFWQRQSSKIEGSYAPNGHDFDDINSDPQESSILEIAVLGNMGKMQDHDLLLRIMAAFKEEPNIRFTLIGSGSQQKMLQEASSSFKHVEIKGRVPHDQVRGLLANAHVGLSLRKAGVWDEYIEPVRCFEYLGAGIPCVISPTNSFSQSLEEAGVAWTFEAHEEEQIIHLLRSMLQDRFILDAYRNKSRESSQNFHRKRGLQQISDVLNQHLA